LLIKEPLLRRPFERDDATREYSVTLKKTSWIAIILLFASISEGMATSFTEMTRSMEKQAGLFDVYYDRQSGKVYLAIEAFEQDFILLTSLPYGLGSNDIGLDRGLQGGSRLAFFRRVGNRVFLVQKNTYYRAESNNLAERQSIREAFAESVLAGFDLVAEQQQPQTKVLIDMTPFLLQDLMGVAERIQQTQQGQFHLDPALSTLDESVIKSFPKNTELQSILTFSGSGAGRHLLSVSPDGHHFTLRQRVSLVALPEPGYEPREFHPFSGFWSFEYKDYAAALTEPMTKRFIPRHRLKKKDPTAEVSEPVEPIVYYLDNGVPEPVRTALLEGARWWDQAFEAAGYKNAFQVKMLPEGADPMDVRYNVIQWVHRATRGWSYGAGVIDPRTGEIIKGHVTLGSLRVRQDLMIAQGLTLPFANEVEQQRQQEMALARIRQLSAHEVGHTLGIAHNFAASVSNRASVMDYPHPLVTLNDDQTLSLRDAYAEGIGEWDKQVIKYGYGDYGSNEKAMLKKIIAESKAKGLQFISDPDARPVGGLHADAHLWDNGSDAADELERIIKVRQIALKNFSADAIADGTPFSQLEEVLVPVYNLHRYQVEAAVKLIAGLEYQYAVKGEDDFVLSTVNQEQQEKALKALQKTLAPEFLRLDQRILDMIPPKAYGYSRTRESFPSKTGLSLDPLTIAEASATHTLQKLLHAERLTRLAQQGARGNLSAAELLAQLTDQLTDVRDYSGVDLQIAMRVLAVYAQQLVGLVEQPQLPIEAEAAVMSELDALKTWTSHEMGRTRKKNPRYGYYLSLKRLLDNKIERLDMNRTPVELPPGSPIGG
jgi:hypothetical protein